MQRKMVTVLRQGRRLLQSPPETLVAIVIAAILSLLAATSNAAEHKTAEASKASEPATSAPSPSAIPVEEIAMQATQVGNLLRGVTANLAPDPEIDTIRRMAPELAVNTALELQNTTNIVKEQTAVDTLETQQQIWQQRQLQFTAWLNVLTRRATKLQVALNQLARLQETWTRTRDVQQSATAPNSILQQIDSTLEAIGAAQQPHQAERNEILNLQGQIAEMVARCNTALAEIAAVQQMLVGGLFTRESRPVWDADLWGRAKDTLAERLPKTAASYWRDLLIYVHDPSRHMPRHIALFVVLSIVLFAARRQCRTSDAGTRSTHGTAVFDHVFAAAFLVTLIVATAPTSPVPVAVKRLFEIAGLVPIIILTRRSLPPVVVPVIYALAILFAIDSVRRSIIGEPPMGQGILILEAAAGIVLVVWLFFYGAHIAARGLGQTNSLRRLVGALIVAVLAVGLVAAIFGYMRLARLTIPGVLAGGALALELYAAVQVAMGLVVYGLRIRPLRLLHLVQNHTDLLERRIYRFLMWVAVVAWLTRYLDYLGLFDPAWSTAQAFFGTRLERGSISTSVGDIGAFLLTLLAAYLLSAFIRFVLAEDVYSRARIATG